MAVHETIAVWTDREPTLDEELRVLGEEDVFEMANLPPEWTGVLATIFISTALGQHGPRIKLYLKPGRHQPSASISIGPNPRVLASSLDERDLARIAPKALEWVALNHAALTSFWFEGETMNISDVADFGRSLKKV
ncbi:hypothetical protein [Brevundimonas sp. Root1279]|uniref:hypothetical protein n=1 Tax=Brevundimonas sp. Root1279 TaxID=1736443 RepID=UPI0006F69B19|nr:hypothetical protein [Brevundimonas sp. Root1279]KQW86584.1 hypothetical protein ASC65_01435 [Brevundimonas sp. Root1279]